MRPNLYRGLPAGALFAIMCLFFIPRLANAAPAGSIDLTNLDRTCKPCADFFQFAVGSWIKKNSIPASYPAYSNFQKLADTNRDVLHTILEKASKASNPLGSNVQKIGDYYGSCMDAAGIQAAGLTPLQPEFSETRTIANAASLATQVARLQRSGVDALFGFGSDPDAKNSAMNIGVLTQGGLGLPDRDYYLNDDQRSKSIRASYVAHVQAMFTLAGDSAAKSAAEANSVMSIETNLAKNSLTRVARRDPVATYHKMTFAQLQALAPNFSWSDYMRASGLTMLADINVSEPAFFKALSEQLSNLPTADLQTYLRWHVLDAYAPTLPSAFVDENFNFHGRVLQGTKELQPRWRRCVRATDIALGEALGQVYVAQTFSPAAKARALRMVKNIKEALREDFSTLSWMTPQTRNRAVAKLDAFILKIGYPDKWRDYSALTISRDSYAANVRRASEFESARDIGKIGHAVDRTEWGMSTPTVNAYYNPSINEIVFPAGILRPPFFDPKADDAVNYGGIGAVVGHESTHGFDDEGRQYDLKGNLIDWWTLQDSAAFNARASCIVKQYDALTPLEGVHENGKLVQGEAIADLGGLTIAYKAFQKSMRGKPRRLIDGFTPEQRFFLSWAQVWASNERPEYVRLLAQTDVHAYDKFRVNATVANMPGFAKAWFCPLNAAMVRPPQQRCQIW
ncbi:MAG: M13 family metallopeptidase [Candidatus Eremiobacteraeota bacterium]|nr:M13 family metallopeptidase [Candidatus Eremiobacteraeota bacterium]